jgi:aryl-alcohol dehydrogenase-like predicted oxidoreductase/predicted kinase
MRLSTDANRDDARSLEILRTALAEGITLLDTADVYALGDHDIGHNEKLIASALSSASDQAKIEVVTKGGLVRPDGAWVPKGNARHLDAAARASRERLGAIDLYLLHVVDPRVPLATSVRALAKLRDEGVVRAIGLSNVTLHQLEQALELAPITAIEIELGPHKLDALHTGLVAFCRERGIRVIAYRPLGGRNGVKRLARDEKLASISAEIKSTPHELALAWLAAKGVVPIPGATRVETVRSIARANRLVLSDAVVAELDTYFLDDAMTGESQPHSLEHATAGDTNAHSLEEATTEAGERGKEVILVMGMPGSGKTTIAKQLEAQGYARLNRDERGGSLAELARELGRELAAGATRVVLDNTYGSRASRSAVVRAARKHGARVSCRVVTTSLEQAQHNAVSRILDEHGRLLEPAEMQAAKAIGPGAQFRYRKSYEPPRIDEGFASVDEIAFERRPGTGAKRALVVELDSIVWRARPKTSDGVTLVDGVRDHLARWHAAGFLLAGTTWQTPPGADDMLRELLQLPMTVLRCAHPAGPPVCWCRKPMPGLALAFARANDVDLAKSVHVGHGPADRGFAIRAGIEYADVADGWPEPADYSSA